MMRKIISVWLALALTSPQAVLGPLWAAEAEKPERASLSAVEVEADQVRLRLSAPVKYNTFVTATPPRLVLEMINTEFALSTKIIEGKGRYLKRVRSGQYAGEPNPIARIVLDLTQPVNYRILLEGSDIIVRLESGEKPQQAAEAPLPGLPQPAAAEEAENTQEASLDAVQVGKDQVRLQLSSPVQFNPIAISNPPRLILEMINAKFALSTKTIPGKGKYLQRVRSSQYAVDPSPIVRTVLDLAQPVGYRVLRDGNDITVLLGGGEQAEQAAPAPVAERAATPDAASLDAIEVGQDRIRLQLSSPVDVNPIATSAPPRLVLEMVNAKFALSMKAIQGKGKYLKRVHSSQFATQPNPIVHTVLDLTQPVGYRVLRDGNNITVLLEGREQSKPTVQAPPAAPAAPLPAVPATPLPVPASAPAVSVTPPLPAAPALPLAAPAPAPVASVSPPPPPPPARPKAPQESALPENMTTQNADELSAMAGQVSAIPGASAETAERVRTAAARAARPKRDIMATLPRDMITVDLDGTDIRDALKMMAAKANINLIYGSDVAGTMSLHLTNVPFSEAFNIILSENKLVASQVGENILRISTPATLQSARTSAVGVTRVFPINYSLASEAKTQVDQVRTAEGRIGNSVVDAKNNALIVTETPEGMAAVERLLAMIDTRPRQVLIEAKLVEVKLNRELDLGIQWDYLGQSPSGQVGGQRAINEIGAANNPATNASGQPLTGGTPFNAATPNSPASAGRGTGVILPADKIFGAFTFGRITNNYFLTATLTAAASQGKVKVLSDPKIATLNGKQASINITTQTPYVTSNVSSTGVSTQQVAFVTTGIQLAVTPTINADGRISLLINPQVSQPSATAASSSQTGAIGIDSRQVQTQVMVKDGETIVIGGLITDSVANTEAKVPLLGDIPVLGWLFKKKTIIRSRVELLIFVTTKVMPD